MEPVVTLRPAYAWDCEECGRENFARTLAPEFSAEELAELRSEHGVQPWEAGEFVSMPDRVECAFCHAAFATKHLKDA